MFSNSPREECALYAIIGSMPHQVPDHALSIDDLRCILDGPEMTERMAPLSDVGQSSLTVDQIAAVLQLWGKQRPIVLRLNIIVDGAQLKMPFPLMIAPQSGFTTTTLWSCSAMT